MQNLNTKNAPLHVLMGLPPHLEAEETTQLVTPLPGCHISDGVDGLLTFPTAMERDGWDVFFQLERFPGITATRLAHSLSCHCDSPPYVNVVPICELAPAQHNAWTDGSLTANRSCYAQGGYGIWHPERYKTEIAINELQFGHIVDVGSIHGASGVALAGTLLEPFSSSTRNEVAAMIVAMSAFGPVHIATDSLSAVTFANRIINQRYQPAQAAQPLQRW